MLQSESVKYLFKGERVIPENSFKTVLKSEEKRVAVIYSSDGADATEAEKNMLQKLLAACKISPDEVEIINNRKLNLSLATVQNGYKPKYILLFGETGAGINLSSLKTNTPFNLSGTHILKTLSLDKLVSNDREKAHLWKALQSMFLL